MCYTENPKEDNNNISKIHIQYSLMNILFDKKGTRYKKDDVKEYNNKNNAEASRQTIAIPLAANFTSAILTVKTSRGAFLLKYKYLLYFTYILCSKCDLNDV